MHVPSCVLSYGSVSGARLLSLFASVSCFQLHMSSRILFFSDDLDNINVSRYVLKGRRELGGRGGLWSGGSAMREGCFEWRMIRSKIWWTETLVTGSHCSILTSFMR